MSETLLFYSSHSMTEEELASVLQEAGGQLTPGGPFEARISHETSHVWITVEHLQEGMFNEVGFALLEQAKKRLGGEPLKTCLSLGISRIPGSQRLAVRFAYICCQHWPCAVDKETSCIICFLSEHPPPHPANMQKRLSRQSKNTPKIPFRNFEFYR